LVAGRVQGVYYRAAAAEQAQRLGVDGCVRNLADGRVEVIAGGPPAAVAELVRWLWEGPPAASVESVQVEEWRAEIPIGFAVAP